MTKNNRETSQKNRFVSTARALECDESEERFDKALRAVAKHKPIPREKASEKEPK